MYSYFWDYSVEIYAKPGIADNLLSLQNDHGADVNMLLFCCWTGITRGVFTDQSFNKANDFSHSWCEHAVSPLRQVRAWMKHSGCESDSVDSDWCMSLREKVKSVELQAEKLQQYALESIIAAQPDVTLSLNEQQNAMVINLKRYLDSADIRINDRIIHQLTEVIRMSFPQCETSPQFIRKAFLPDSIE